jgi:hypothetical protein
MPLGSKRQGVVTPRNECFGGKNKDPKSPYFEEKKSSKLSDSDDLGSSMLSKYTPFVLMAPTISTYEGRQFILFCSDEIH